MLLCPISLTPCTMFLLLLVLLVLFFNVLLVPGSISTCPKGVSGDLGWCGVTQ